MARSVVRPTNPVQQEPVDQYPLTAEGAGFGDKRVSNERAMLFESIQFMAVNWTAQPADADRFLADRPHEACCDYAAAAGAPEGS